MSEELNGINPLFITEEELEVGKVNGICYNIVELMRKQDFDEQLLIYSLILEHVTGKDNG